MKMMLAGEPIDAGTAGSWGIVEEVVADDMLDATVLAYASVVASRSPRTTRLLKRVVRTGLQGNLADGLQLERDALTEVFASADYAEGLRAFAERRPPNFAD
jgi:enoyl-CoA hydratase/carnithine racemase